MDDVSYLDAEAVFAALSPAEAVSALRETLAGGFDPSDDIPRTVTDISAGNMIFMPSEFGQWVGVKLVGVSTGNAERGSPRILGQYLMYEASTARLRTVIDGAALTTLRTPAVSVAAVLPALSRFPDPVKVVIFGAGPQGIGHADTIRAELDVAEAVFVVRSPTGSATRCEIVDGYSRQGRRKRTRPCATPTSSSPRPPRARRSSTPISSAPVPWCLRAARMIRTHGSRRRSCSLAQRSSSRTSTPPCAKPGTSSSRSPMVPSTRTRS